MVKSLRNWKLTVVKSLSQRHEPGDGQAEVNSGHFRSPHDGSLLE